jgi:hypothetical protein
LRLDKNMVRALMVLARTRLIGWGTVGLIAIVGQQMAGDLHTDIATVFSGSSVLYQPPKRLTHRPYHRHAGDKHRHDVGGEPVNVFGGR